MVFARRFPLLLLSIALAGLTACQPADPDPTRFEKAIQQFKAWDLKDSTPAAPILFIGSSSIGGWKTAEFFPGLPVVNRGFGGSQISDINHYFEHVVLPYRPRAIVFYAGENDIHTGKRPARVVADYKRFVEQVQAVFPETSIFFLPMKPSPSRWHLWEKMREGNEHIHQFSETDPRLFYVDTATPLLGSDGTPDPALFLDDELHMTAAGYDRWVAVLKPYLERIMEAEEE